MKGNLVMKRSIFGCALVALGLVGSGAFGVGTRSFELRRGDDFKGGELRGVAVDSSGAVRAGLDLGKIEVGEVSAIWSALALDDGSLLLGTGNEGKLLKVSGAKVEVAAESDALALTSLVRAWDGRVVAASLPDGKVFTYRGGKLEVLAELEGAEHVWQLAYDASTGSLFAATGPEGKLFRIDRAGKAQVYFDVEEQHLMSVAVGPKGKVYVGASDRAKLYEVSSAGRGTVLYDFERTEVPAIAVAPDGTVFAIANEIKPGSQAPERKGAEAAAGPAPKATPVKGKGILVEVTPEGAPYELMDDKDEHFVSLALGDDLRPHVGTGVEGRIYSVDAERNRILVADTDERRVSSMILTGKSRFVATSDPAVLRPVRGVGGPDSIWTSKVLDAGLRATFGRMKWEASGTLEFSTRTGNTKEPDATWSDWSPPITRPSPVVSPPGRFFQVRARFTRDPSAELSEVTVPFVTDNLRAIVTEVSASGASTTQTGIQASGGPIESKPSTKVSLTWKVDNPDKDELRYRLEYRLVGTTDYYDLFDPRERLTKTTYEWDTASLPEGRYRVRVKATDELSNPPERVTQHHLESDVVLVDNTPPVIDALAVNGRVVSGVVVDGIGPITRIELAPAGTEEWVPFFPKDGVFDESREAFTADVTPFAPSGRVLISIRAYDAAGNFVVRSVTVK
jgi:hypothetical protein